MIGLAAPLIVGDELFGPDNVQLQSVSVGNISMRPDGMFTAVTLSFKFKEFREDVEEINSKAGLESGDSALSVRASKTDIAAKKNPRKLQ